MTQDKPINKPLVLVSAIILLVLNLLAHTTVRGTGTNPTHRGLVVILGIALWPLLVLWMKALWNEVIPRVTGWRKVTFIEAAGLIALAMLFAF